MLFNFLELEKEARERFKKQRLEYAASIDRAAADEKAASERVAGWMATSDLPALQPQPQQPPAQLAMQPQLPPAQRPQQPQLPPAQQPQQPPPQLTLQPPAQQPQLQHSKMAMLVLVVALVVGLYLATMAPPERAAFLRRIAELIWRCVHSAPADAEDGPAVHQAIAP